MLFAIYFTGALSSQALEVNSSNVIKTQKKIKHSNGRTYDPLPIGTILMYAGNNWEDNSTIKGWYACTSNKGIINNIAIPNLEDKFIRGSNEDQVEEKPYNTRSGGSNSDSISLTVANIPEHSHTIDHDHKKFSISGGRHSHEVANSSTEGTSTDILAFGDNGSSLTIQPSSYTKNSNHSHDVDIPPLSDTAQYGPESQYYKSGVAGSGTSFSVDTVPAYYRVIYIIKVSHDE